MRYKFAMLRILSLRNERHFIRYSMKHNDIFPNVIIKKVTFYVDLKAGPTYLLLLLLKSVERE
jgi:hypothetical protein